MRRAHSLPIALLAATTMAGAAVAQTPQTAARQDLRQLSWPGRHTATTSPAASAPTNPNLRRSNLVIPHGGFAASAPPPAASAAPAVRRTLTPASAWLRPVPPPPSAPAMAAPSAADIAPPPPPTAFVARPAATPEYLPDPGGRGQRAPAEIIYPAAPELAPPAPTMSPDQPADPMAPRRDAPIFRLQQPAPPPEPAAQPPVQQSQAAAAPRPRYVAEVTNTGERPAQQGARYYSVHRQNGRQPDTLAMPEPTYVDALAITMTETPASQDLAQPDQGPTLIRDNQGRVRPAAAASDGDHQ